MAILRACHRHGSDIEKRLDDLGGTRDSLKADNRRYADAFTRHGEQVTLIRSDYEMEASALLCVPLT